MNAATVGRRYRLERLLGHGGMAAVYLGHDVDLERPVAVKVLADALAADGSFRRRFLREARIAARLSHPNVVQIYDVGEEHGRPYIVMEFVDGETLAQQLARAGPLSPEEAVAQVVDVCAGLEHAHAAGLVHRDIKPGNLIRRSDGIVKIADFGIARAEDETRLTAAGSVMGTAGYIAPEQAAGREVTGAADLYAVGAVLYQLLTGSSPHQTGTPTELLARQHNAGVARGRVVPDLPPALEMIVLRCLAFDPRDRPPSAAALAHELAAAIEAPPTLALPDPAGIRATDVTAVLDQPPADDRRRRLLTPFVGLRPWRRLASLAVLAIALALGLTFGLGGEDRPGAGTTRQPVEVEPADDPGELAGNLAEWLRSHAATP